MKLTRFFAVVFSAAWLCGQAFAAGAAVKVDVAWASQDQRGWQAFFLADALKRRLGEKVEFKVTTLIGKDKAGAWTSSRGEAEIAEAKRVAVVGKLYPSALWTYLTGRSLNSWEGGWKEAAIFAGIAPEKLEKEAAAKGDSALEEHFAYAKAKNLSDTAVLINGAPYAGEWLLLPLAQAVNEALPKELRANFPAPAKAAAGKTKLWVVVSDEKGPAGEEDKNLSASIARMLSATQLEMKTVSYSEAAKNPELKGLDIDFVPFYAVEAGTEARNAFAYAIEKGAASLKGDYIVLSGGGDGVLVKKPKQEKTLEAFVMAMCPYGVLAEKSLGEAVEKNLLPPGVTVKLRYILSVSEKDGAKTFSSLHGSAEWEEAVRQLLIARDYPEKLWKYLDARNSDPNSSLWEIAASSAGIDAAAIAKNFEAGKELLSKEADYAKENGVSASPTFLWEGRVLLSGVQALKKLPGFEKVPVYTSSKGACK